MERKMGEEITIEAVYEYYTDTIQRCGMYLCNASDDDIEYEIFEEFDIGATSFLFDDVLHKLNDANLITEDIMIKSSLLRRKFFEIQGTPLWNIEAVRTSDEWKDILLLADEINQDLHR